MKSSIHFSRCHLPSYAFLKTFCLFFIHLFSSSAFFSRGSLPLFPNIILLISVAFPSSNSISIFPIMSSSNFSSLIVIYQFIHEACCDKPAEQPGLKRNFVVLFSPRLTALGSKVDPENFFQPVDNPNSGHERTLHNTRVASVEVCDYIAICGAQIIDEMKSQAYLACLSPTGWSLNRFGKRIPVWCTPRTVKQ